MACSSLFQHGTCSPHLPHFEIGSVRCILGFGVTFFWPYCVSPVDDVKGTADGPQQPAQRRSKGGLEGSCELLDLTLKLLDLEILLQKLVS